LASRKPPGSTQPRSVVIRDRIIELRRVPAHELQANPRNWRQHPAEQVDALAGVLGEIGFAGAELCRALPDGSLMLIDGHARATLAGEQLVPCLVTDLTEGEADLLLATFDPIGAMAKADTAKLDALLREVETGDEAVAKMLEDLAKEAGCEWAKNGEIIEDEVPEPPADPITKPGDLWVLGDHRLLCGDSTKAEDVDRLFAGGRASLLFTSPPYAQQRDYTKESKDAGRSWDDLMQGVFQHASRIMEPDGQILVNLGLVHRDGEWMPYWDGWIEWMRAQGWRRFGWYVWDQGFGLPGDWNGRFAPSHEFVFHFNLKPVRPEKCADKKPENIKSRNKGGSTMRGADGVCRDFTNPEASAQPTKILDSVLRVKRMHGGHNINHPAIFPVAFSALMLQSWPGLAYEPFSGSGTTIIAAEQLSRRCYAMEISPAYCDVAVQRWEKLTGKKAEVQHGS
jgi:DNA modification methylase